MQARVIEFEFGVPSSASVATIEYEYGESSLTEVPPVLVMTGSSGWSDSTDNCEAALLAFPAASLATPAATSIVTSPSADGVIVRVYVVPLPDRVAEPPEIEASESTNPVTDSLNVTVTSNVEVVNSAAEAVIETVGLVASTITDPRSPPVIVVEALLPSASFIVPPLTEMEDTAMSESSPSPSTTV